MKRTVLFLFLACSILQTRSQSTNMYRFYLDITAAKNDRLEIVLTPPPIKTNQITYYIPSIVPGTYQVLDFGSYISAFKAFDKKGRELNVVHPDPNSWKITNARSLARISYIFDDTYDKEQGIFFPAATSIEDSVLMLNTHTALGYFEGMKDLPYELTIKKPAGFFGSTSMKKIKEEVTYDVYLENTYGRIADSPVMYNIPDTSGFYVAGTKVLVSVYSTDHQPYAQQTAGQIESVLKAFGQFFNGKLPVDHYTFIIYQVDYPASMLGALEHSFSSVYFIRAKMSGMVKDMVAHEFYHIVTPLNLHSEKISDFNYQSPVMSKHLWLYEGVTEYMAHYILMRGGLVTFKRFLGDLVGNIYESAKYNDTIPFTYLSEHIVEYQDQYLNVYQKGPLIAACMDIQLRYYSKGKKGLQDLVNELISRYGDSRYFNDDDLFNVITSMGYPETGNFLKDHVEGNKPLPLKETFDMVGIRYLKDHTYREFSIGGFGVNIHYFDTITKFGVADTLSMNAFGKKMGYRTGDILEEINGLPYTIENRTLVFKEIKEGDTLTVVVLRRNKEKKFERTTLKAPVFQVQKTTKFMLEPMDSLTGTQQEMRDAWVGSR